MIEVRTALPPQGDISWGGAMGIITEASRDVLCLLSWIGWWFCCRKGDPLPGPKGGLLSNTQKWILQGDIHADQARDSIGKGPPGGEQEEKGTQEGRSATRLADSGFMVMGPVSRFSGQSDSGFFVLVRALLSQNGCQQEGFWEAEGHVTSPLDLSRILPVGSSLLVLRSLPGPPVIK